MNTFFIYHFIQLILNYYDKDSMYISAAIRLLHCYEAEVELPHKFIVEVLDMLSSDIYDTEEYSILLATLALTGYGNFACLGIDIKNNNKKEETK